jgi:hypothetical protein
MAASQGGGTGKLPSRLPECAPEDLAVQVRWERDGGGLRGVVIAENISDRACVLPGKPGVIPLGLDGAPLQTQTLITLEMRHPGYVILQPGQRAAAQVSWSSWCGPPASDRAQVSWGDGEVIADVHGPVQPDCSPGEPDNLTSSWFNASS